MIVIFVGWRLKKNEVEEILKINGVKPWYQNTYLVLIRYVVPIVIVLVLIKTLTDAF